MSLRSIKPFRRYIVAVSVLVLFIYLSGIHLDKDSTPSDFMKADSHSIADRYDSLSYVKPLDHDVMKQDLQIQIDNDLHRREKERLRRQIDMKYCGRERCRFLLPIAITEQESKAQEHFRQLAFLSGKLDRTIVLPNVHSSHLGACRRFPFKFYYSLDWLEKNKAFFNYITMDDFRNWVYERNEQAKEMPTAQEVYVETREDAHFLDGATNCFLDFLDFKQWPRKQNYLEDPEDVNRRKGNYTELMLDMLGDEARRQDYIGYAGGRSGDVPPLDVIALFYDRRFTYIENPEVNEPLSYNQHWVSLADSIANQLKPFVAVHWRMERLEPVENLVYCAKSLVKRAQELANTNGDAPLNVFLLTDYPHLLRSPHATPESMSFKLEDLREEHHEAIKYVYERLNVTLTTVEREDRPIPYGDLPAQNWNIIPVPPYSTTIDLSILGIVDKLIAMRAQHFLTGYPNTCGKPSSFTIRIIEERRRVYNAGDSDIITPFGYFFLPPDAP